MQQQEIWKDIKGFEGLYKISNKGRVYSFQTCKYLKPGVNKKTMYKAVVLFYNGKSITKKIHRLIAENFIPNPENKPFVDHIDGDRHNNSIDNLKWVTPYENSNNPITKSKQKYKRGMPRPELGKPVMCIETGIVYESANEAYRQTGIRAESIRLLCMNSAGGYHWKYAEKEAC